ncbi:hypothetical protein GW17_00006551 [Ensete ventricosum]|nr:hypothetical protein GW17_00006551 [Ensete ventricosum]
MLQRANQYTIVEALVAGEREDHKRPYAEKPRGISQVLCEEAPRALPTPPWPNREANRYHYWWTNVW